MLIHTEKNGGFKELLKRMKQLGDKRVYVGVPHSANKIHKDSKISMAGLLATHVLGSPTRNIPARDPMRPALNENAQKYADLFAQGIRNSLTQGVNPEVNLDKLGMVATNDIKEYFVSGSFVPLKQSTIDKKGSSKPLIDTGELRNSITYEVR